MNLQKLGLFIHGILPGGRFALALFLLVLMAFSTLYVFALSPILLTLSSLGLLGCRILVLLQFFVLSLALLIPPIPSVLTLGLLGSSFSTLLCFLITSLVCLGFLVSSLLYALPSLFANLFVCAGSPPREPTFLSSVFFLVFSSDFLFTALFDSLFLTFTTWGFVFCAHSDFIRAHSFLTSRHAHRRLTSLGTLSITFVFIVFFIRDRSPMLQALGFCILYVLIDSIAYLSLGISLSLSKLNLTFVIEPILIILTSIRTPSVLTAGLKQGVGFPGLLTFFSFLLLAMFVSL